jgi:hypothetical protein
VSGLEVPVLFWDRNSTTALIAGPSIRAPKESMCAFANLFDTYDVISIDYRWSNNYFSSLLTSIILCSPIQRMLLDEEEEVYAAIDFIKQHKKYEKIIGFGECYSTFLLTKIQADNVEASGQGPFTHLILDSCWHSLISFTESVCNDPFLPFNSQDGGAPWLLKKIMNSPIIKWPLLEILFAFVDNVSVEEHLPKINLPILFVYGDNDIFVSKDHFESIWNAARKDTRAVLLTPYRHADNLHNKPVYKFICEQFIGVASITDFQENCKYVLNGGFEPSVQQES